MLFLHVLCCVQFNNTTTRRWFNYIHVHVLHINVLLYGEIMIERDATHMYLRISL